MNTKEASRSPQLRKAAAKNGLLLDELVGRTQSTVQRLKFQVVGCVQAATDKGIAPPRSRPKPLESGSRDLKVWGVPDLEVWANCQVSQKRASCFMKLGCSNLV